ncbi:hypothetical protein GS454_28450, partial [Rhodococcus hoagii]|nr:hypothetical protein [Prescottella equi]
MAEMLKGGVIMDVVTPEQAKIAEDAPALSRSWRSSGCPPTIRAQGGRLAHVGSGHDRRHHRGGVHPGQAKARIGHFVEAQIRAGPLGVDGHRRFRGPHPRRLRQPTSTSSPSPS